MIFKSFPVLVFCFACLISCATSPLSGPVRIATFNIAMGHSQEGELLGRLVAGDDPRLIQLAEILQRVRPDIVLLNEFDYSTDAVPLLRENYLQRSWQEQVPIHYSHAFIAPSNTGVDSGLDLDGNGKTGDPNDAWGFGTFPGQYGMLVLSRFPIDKTNVRIFRNFLWKHMPDALRPYKSDGNSYYPDPVWKQLRLSSKSHWDLPIRIAGDTVHFLVSHPTPPVFDGPEDRNGKRNFDEIRFWTDYIDLPESSYIYDDKGQPGGLGKGANFVIAGDLNSDPADGDSRRNSVLQLLNHASINSECTPQSNGAREAARIQGGVNMSQKGDSSADTADFSDNSTGNLRLDYVLPSQTLNVSSCGVYWPAMDEAGHERVAVSDHRLVWLDIEF